MQHLYYLTALIVALGCIVLVDFRYKLAFFADWRRATSTLMLAVLFFVVWDAAGIGLNIFYEGAGKYTTGILLAPHFPLEELFFLSLLNYTVLVTWLGLGKKHV